MKTTNWWQSTLQTIATFTDNHSTRDDTEYSVTNRQRMLARAQKQNADKRTLQENFTAEIFRRTNRCELFKPRGKLLNTSREREQSSTRTQQRASRGTGNRERESNELNHVLKMLSSSTWFYNTSEIKRNARHGTDYVCSRSVTPRPTTAWTQDQQEGDCCPFSW